MDVTDGDVELATDMGVLALILPEPDGGKLVAAVEGVLAAERAAPLRASLHRRKTAKRSA